MGERIQYTSVTQMPSVMQLLNLGGRLRIVSPYGLNFFERTPGGTGYNIINNGAIIPVTPKELRYILIHPASEPIIQEEVKKRGAALLRRGQPPAGSLLGLNDLTTILSRGFSEN